MLLNCGVGEDSWESLGLQGDQTSQSSRKSVLIIHWKDWCWSWSSNPLATWCEELTHWKRPWCWERLKAVGEGDDRGWDGWMASLTRWIWVWASSGSWCCPWGRKESDMTERLKWTELNWQHEGRVGHSALRMWESSSKMVILDLSVARLTWVPKGEAREDPSKQKHQCVHKCR